MKLQQVREHGVPCGSCGALIPIPDIDVDTIECAHCGRQAALADHVDRFTLDARRAYDDRVDEMERRETGKRRTDTIVITVVVIALLALTAAAFAFGS